jgi:NADPH:quinone reductase-like Zn-dependent oxidoreductase
LFLPDNWKERFEDVVSEVDFVESNGADMEAIADLLEQGTLRSNVSRIFSFDKRREAHIEMETGRTVGKIVAKPKCLAI